MPDERKPVICPWCGFEMAAYTISIQGYSGEKKCFYECAQCCARSPMAVTNRDAYAAATRTPPNRPMDYKTIYNLTDREPVWRVDKDDDVIVLGGYNAWRKYDAVRYLYFAANPSPADIEAARKERDD